MFDVSAWFMSLGIMAAFGLLAWIYGTLRRDVSGVDSLWSLFFLLGLVSYILLTPESGPRQWLVLALVTLWSLRLSIYITVRGHGEAEDRRYQAIRKRNEPNFRFKSLYIVYGLQVFLAWVICLPIIAAVNGQTAPGPLDFAGIVLWCIGMVFEAGGDWQLSRFLRHRNSKDAVMDAGLWRYTRHPNYFGNALIWWGFYLIALSAGAWWTIVAPLMMTFLLMRVSGVALLEKDIAERRPAYRDYIERTNAFIPGPPRKSRAEAASGLS